MILNAIYEGGYRMVTVVQGGHLDLEMYWFESAQVGKHAERLRSELTSMGHRLDQEAAQHRREAAEQSRERAEIAEELRALRARLQDAEEEQALLRQGADDARAALAAKERTLETLHRDFIQLREKHQALERSLEDVSALAASRGEEVASLERENASLRDRASLVDAVAPMIEELDLPPQAQAERHRKLIRIACPGVSEEQMDITPLSNGVRVQVLPAQHDEEPRPLFSKEFIYDDKHGFFQLSQCEGECGIENGVLILVLHRIPKPKLKMGRVSRVPPVRIDEEQSLAEQPRQYILSPSPSLGTLSQVSSSWVVPDSADAQSEGASSFGRSSWMSQGGPNCFMPFTLFKMASESAGFLPANDLQSGFHVMAADGTTVLEVLRVVKHKAREIIRLEAGEATLAVTGNHRMLVPPTGGSAADASREVHATKLQIGDAVFCKTEDGKTVSRELTDVLVIHGDEAGKYDVFEITFRPDVPVAVFQEPAELMLCKGFKKKRPRRAIKATSQGDTFSMPDTAAGEYSD